jgi:serine phosphatase RsbU (regulator of sigma subunit)/CHASE2 domain-containing sensor protein
MMNKISYFNRVFKRWLPLIYILPLVYLLKPVLWKPVDFRFYNYFQSKRRVPPWTEVTVVGIDEETVDNIFTPPVFPFSRHIDKHDKLLKRIYGAGAKAVVFDLRFSKDDINLMPVDFIDTIKRFGNVYLVMSITENRRITKSGNEIIRYKKLMPYDRLIKASQGAYVVNVTIDPDGYLRRYSSGSTIKKLGLQRLPEKLSGVMVERAFPIDYPSIENPMPCISYRDVLESDKNLSELFQGRIVFVGSVYEEAKDFVAVPREQIVPGNIRTYHLPGVMALAVVTENLIDGMPMRDARWYTVFLFILAFCMVIVIFMPGNRPVLSALLLLSVSIVSLTSAAVLQIVFGVVFPAGFVFGAVVTTGVFTWIRNDIETSKQLYEEEAENKRVRREIETARETQVAFLPDLIPQSEGVDIWGLNISSKGVSGDYYDIIKREDRNSLVIAIGDVSGKGLPASLLMSNVQAGLHSHLFQEQFDCRSSVINLNRLVYENTGDMSFVTFLLAELETKTMKLEYVRAGHEFPFIVSSDESRKELTEGGLALGILLDAKFESSSVDLKDGDVVCFYTDGLTEARSVDGEEFGYERLYEVVKMHSASGAKVIAEETVKAIKDFTQLQKQADDVTLVIICIKE